MLKLRLVFISLLILLSISLRGSVPCYSEYPQNRFIVIVNGFSNYPDVKFYVITVESLKHITIDPVEGDEIVMQQDPGDGPMYISWNPRFRTFEPWYSYDIDDPVLKQLVPRNSSQSMPQTMLIPANQPLKKIGDIVSSYELGLYKNPTSRQTYKLTLFRRVYRCGSFRVNTIDIKDHFAEMQSIIEFITNIGEVTPYFQFRNIELGIINAYADSLSKHQTTMEKVIRNYPNIEKLLTKPPTYTLIQYTLKDGNMQIGNDSDRYLSVFILILIITIIIKLISIILLFLPISHLSPPGRIKSIYAISLIGTTVTLSAIWWVFPLILDHFVVRLVISGAFAILTDGILLSYFLKLQFTKATRLAFISNLVAYIADIIIVSLIILGS